MLKAVLFLFALSVITTAQARSCKVYGITDSPQELDCSFSDLTVKLRCVDGRYYLNQEPVKMAFHHEVESGTVPLVFKARELSLLVMLDTPITAEIEDGRVVRQGQCTRSVSTSSFTSIDGV